MAIRDSQPTCDGSRGAGDEARRAMTEHEIDLQQRRFAKLMTGLGNVCARSADFVTFIREVARIHSVDEHSSGNAAGVDGPIVDA